MKRYIIYILISLFALGTFTSCEQEQLVTTFGDSKTNTLTLRLNTGGLESRATIDGEDANNENKIQKLDCFLYNDNNVVHKTVTPNNALTGTEEHTIPILFEEEDMTKLFGEDYKTNGNNRTCLIYVIANRPDGVSVTGEESIEALKQKTLTGAFTTNAKQETFVMDSDGKNDSDGNDVVTLKVENNTVSLSGYVPLYRSAAKVGLFVHVPESIENVEGENTTIWTPVAGSMTVKFHKGVKTGNIDNSAFPYTIQDSDYFVTDERSFNVTNSTLADTEGTVYSQTTSVPFYTYPTSTAEGQGTYFTLNLSWKSVTGGSGTDNDPYTYQYKNCSYQIPVNKLEALERNNYYRLLLNVGVLGTESGVVTLEPSYTVLNWNDENINTSIEENVYLVVQEHDVFINNKNTYSVEFASSHDIEVQILSITQPNYSQEIAGTSVFCDYNKGEGKDIIERGTDGVVIIDDEEQNNIDVSLYRDCSVNVSGNTIVLNHNVVNRGEETAAKEYDIAPYTIVVYVKMVYGSGENDYYEDTIEFTQYPSMYVEAKLNDRDDEKKGNVYVYNENAYDNPQWSTVRGASHNASSGSNSNPNMYVIYISALSTSDSYVISDPRDTGTSIAGNTDGWDINNEDDLGNRLTNYYQTRTDNSDLIAPIFRMASSHGKCGSKITYNDAKRRCAAYQEDGLPAGRWRVPTTAELRYIAKLSSENKIPHLYSNEGNYWTATARCTYYTNGTVSESTNFDDNSTAYVRCVYDEWYWGSTQLEDKTQFTWGDE